MNSAFYYECFIYFSNNNFCFLLVTIVRKDKVIFLTFTLFNSCIYRMM